MNETRFSVSEAVNLELGEVVYLFIDRAGYRTSSMNGSTGETMKGATVFATAIHRNSLRYFIGWTDDDVDLPLCALNVDIGVIRHNYSGLNLVKNHERFTKYVMVCDYEQVMRAPIAQRIAATKRVGPDELVCCRCKEPTAMAAPNMADGSFKCYTCRANPFR